jgi:exodeoxyribonuclease VII large subunit
VQGDGAKGDIVEALKYFNRKQLADVILLVRGGGSLEDLWAFNEEVVARAISDSAIPIISGVGHETDFTIADFVADMRASTPSNAAEIVVKTRLEFENHVADLQRQLAHHIRYFVLDLRDRLRELATHPNFQLVPDLLHQRQQQLDELTGRMAQQLAARVHVVRQRSAVVLARLASYDLRSRLAALRARLEQRQTDLRARMERFLTHERDLVERAMLRLDERSPLNILARGYAIVSDTDGNMVRGVEAVAPGDLIGVRFSRGRLEAEVRKKFSTE